MGDGLYLLLVSLFNWVPAPLAYLCLAVVALFFISMVLHLISWLWDVIPFL